MAQCNAKTKDGSLCQIPARDRQKYCHIHRRQRLWRIILSASAIGAIILGLIGFIANITGVLGYFGINPPARSTLQPTSTLTPLPTFTLTPTSIPVLFQKPSLRSILAGFEIAGYSKQTSLVRDSHGRMTLFIRNDNGDLAYATSSDEGKSWNEPNVFDNFPPPGGPQVSAVVDSADLIHVVWGHAPEAGNAEYGLLKTESNEWLMRETVGTGVF